MLDDLQRQNFRRRQFIQIIEAVVLQPEDVEIGLVASNEFIVGEIPEAIGFCTIMSVFRIVADDEVLKIVKLERLGFEGKVFVGTEIIEPDAFGMHVSVFGLGVEKWLHANCLDSVETISLSGKVSANRTM